MTRVLAIALLSIGLVLAAMLFLASDEELPRVGGTTEAGGEPRSAPTVPSRSDRIVAPATEEPTLAHPTSSREEILAYLATVHRGDEVLAVLEEKGIALETLTIPPPFDEVRDAARSAILRTPESEADQRRQLMRWPDEGPDQEWLRNNYHLDRDAELTPLQLVEFNAAADEHNVRVRSVVDEFLELSEVAVAQVIDQDGWEYFPFHTPPGLAAWEGEPRFSSRGAAIGGWCVRLSLKKADHPYLVDLTQRIQEAVWARDDELEAMIQAFEKELGH
jgi:hypothetical protein